MKVLIYFNSIFQLTNHLSAGQAGNLISDHSQLSGKLVRETISLLSMKLLSSSSPEVLKHSHFYSFIVTSRTIYNHLPSIVRVSYCEASLRPSSFLSALFFSISLQQCRKASKQAVSAINSLRFSQLDEVGVSLIPSKQQSRSSLSLY